MAVKKPLVTQPIADTPAPTVIPEDIPAVDVAVPSEKEKLAKQISKIMLMYGGMESNIPPNSEYWGLVSKYRVL